MSRVSFKIFAVAGISLFFTACATIAPPLPPSLNLPKPPSDLHASRKGDHVALIWTIPTITTDRQRARSFGATRICRAINTELTQCGAAVGETTLSGPAAGNSSKKKPTASSTDVLPPHIETDDPSSFATYAVEVRNADGRSAGLSNQVRVALLRTLPPPNDVTAHLVKEGVVVSWANDIPRSDTHGSVQYIYLVQRRMEGTAQWIQAGEVPASTEPTPSFTDSNIEWEKTYDYKVEVRTVAAHTDPQVHAEGDDSPEVRIFAHDVFPPAVPSGLQAVFSGPGQKPFVDLIWAPVPDLDLDGYNIYRREEDSRPVKLNSALVKTPAYRDTDVVSGKHYLYSVSAVDVHGNESARSEEAEENVP